MDTKKSGTDNSKNKNIFKTVVKYLKKPFSFYLPWILLIIMISLICVSSCKKTKTVFGNIFDFQKTEQLVDVSALKVQLEKCSELTTTKLNLSCFAEFKDSGLKFLTRSDFLMTYDVTVRAGIDLKDIDISVDDANRTLYIKIPKARIMGNPYVDPSSIKYYDTKFSLFNLNEKEDANKANAYAEKVALKQAESSGLLEMADQQSAALIKGLMSDIAETNGYTIEIVDK